LTATTIDKNSNSNSIGMEIPLGEITDAPEGHGFIAAGIFSPVKGY
jgi:hypothetical protein